MKLDRLVSIIMVLLEKERAGAQELAGMFEVSPRTIYRDIDAINMAGIPVRSVPGVGGGFEIMPEYKLDKKVFSSSELTAILTGLSGLSAVMQGGELVNALAKVRSILPDDRACDIELKASQIRIDLSPWTTGRKSVQPYMEMIKTALEESRLIRFGYTGRHGNETARTAEPYQLVLKNSDWYIQSYCLEREDFRLFKLSRMSNLQITGDTFTPRRYETPALDFSDTALAAQTDIKLRIHRSVMDRALDYCGYERFTPDGDEYFLVSFPFAENDYYYDVLLSLGDKCECIEPPRVRAELLRRIRALAAIYAD